MNNPETPQSPETPPRISRLTRVRLAFDHDLRIRLGLIVTCGGFVVFLIGCHPQIIGMDRSSIIGVTQIVVFEIGLLVICLGGYTSMVAAWKGQPLSIPADIGLRLVGTGYVIAFFSGFADYFGLGSHKPPNLPFFGPWQATGVIFGEVVIAIGFLMLIPFSMRLFQQGPPEIPEIRINPIPLTIPDRVLKG
jgi:hypothetical protein